MIRSHNNMLWGFLLGISFLVLVIIVRLPSINLPLDNDSGSNAYSARLITQGEPLYGSHHPGHHLPGVYYTYAAIFTVFGDRPESLKIVLILWVWINGLFIYSIGQQLSNKFAGILGAISFVLVTSLSILNGDSAEAELFANLPLTVVCWMAIRLVKNANRPVIYILIGVISALGFLYKAVFLTSLAAVGGMLFLEAALERRLKVWLKFVKRCSLILSGFMLTIGLVFGYFAALGLGQRFLLVFQFGLGYVNVNDRQDILSSLYNPLIMISVANAALAIIAFFSVGRTLIHLPKTLSSVRQEGLLRFMLVVWVFTSLLASGFSGLSFSHYALLLIPPISVLAGIEIGDLWKRIRLLEPHSGYSRRIWLPVLMACAIIAYNLYFSRDYFQGYLSYLSGRSTLAEFVSEDVFLGPANLEAAEIAQYIDQHTSPEERILTWTELAQICYLADRRSSSDVLWPIYVPLLGPPQRILDTTPSYIVLFPYPSSSGQGKLTEWLLQEVKLNYTLEATIGNNQIYKLLKP